MNNDLKCDFCYRPDTRDHLWSFPATDFTVHAMTDTGESFPVLHSTGGWAACNECAELVTKDDRAGIRERIVSNEDFGIADNPTMLNGAMAIIDGYFHHATGPGVPPIKIFCSTGETDDTKQQEG